MAPAGLRLAEQASAGYSATLTATLEIDPAAGEVSIVQFSGPIDLHGSEIDDDEAGGPEALLRLRDGELSGWSGVHVALASEECPPVDPVGSGLSVTHNLEAHIDIVGGERLESAFFVTETNIVSAGVLVTLPGSGTLMLEPGTDIFSPWVDFVESFRFGDSLEGLPQAGEPYGFVLLDPARDPIEGTEWEDVWERCEVEAPGEVEIELLADGSLRVTWSAPPTVFGFDPEAGMGLYQVQVRSASGNVVAGAETTQPEHVLPWSDFGREAPGVPAGTSYGSGLEDLEAGTYVVVVSAYANDDNDPFASTACRMENGDAAGSFIKEGDRIIVG
jgi:hypothetical protein